MVAILKPLKNNKPIPIDRAVILVGRSEDCDVVINGSRKISRKHCCLVQFDDCFLIRDLGSTNGVWVNGKRINQESEIQDGDCVAIGDVQFRFYPEGVKPSSTHVATPEQQSIASDGPKRPGGEIVIMNPVDSASPGDGDVILELTGDGLVNDAEIVVDAASDHLRHSKPEERTSSDDDESEDPVINLDDSFPDEEIEDIVIFDDE
ncbi:MAG: FHA domain-containing protein [Fuerstiella sp.]|nr:FHA domain-containing protein [Fuerstiella sp.]